MNDFIWFIGYIMFGAGIWFEYGWPVALITNGAILLVLATIGALNDTKQDSETEEQADDQA